MPKLERLEWIAPLSEGRGVTLSNDPEADLFLAQDANALLLGVLYDSQYSTRLAFAVPLKLQRRLGHFDMAKMAEADPVEFAAVFQEKPALHRFPRKAAELTQKLAAVIVEQYASDSAGVWSGAADTQDLGARLMALPAFGEEKTNWTVGMLGNLGYLGFDGWDGFRVDVKKRSRKTESA